jgi:lipoic acid synthetase
VLVQLEKPRKRPDWLKAPAPAGDNFAELKALVERLNLNTVCSSAACPNMGECWNHRTATFMILGNFCTRRCGFCAVQKGAPLEVDYDEPRRVAEACETLNLRYAVITSVNRDDRADGGAGIFALTIQAIRQRIPGCRVEVLIPDFQGDEAALRTVMDAAPDVLNHNIETVPRLYKQVRMGARYERSLELLARARTMNPSIPTKSGIMVGLGESNEEVISVLGDMRTHGVEIATIGQYLRPTAMNLPVLRYVTPPEFAEYKRAGMEMGFSHVESGPLVRSSYHAHEAVPV